MLKILRALENLFYSLGDYFADWADSIDTELHDKLRKALNEAFITQGVGRIVGIEERDPLIIEEQDYDH